MSKNTLPVFRVIVGSRSLRAGRFEGSDTKAIPRTGPSPCWTWALLLSIPLWAVIWAIVAAITSAWPS